MQQADGVLVGVVGAEAVGADQLGEAVGLVRRGHVAAPPHLRQADLHARLRQLPRRLRPGEAAADDMDLMVSHSLNFALFPLDRQFPVAGRIFCCLMRAV